jgi:hypothetical protein
VATLPIAFDAADEPLAVVDLDERAMAGEQVSTSSFI